MKSQTERKSDPKALKLKYPSSTQTPNLKNPVKLSSPSSVDEVGARAAWGSCAAPGSCIWWLRWWRPVHLVVEVVFLFLGLKHEKERAAFLGFFSSSASSIFFFFWLVALISWFLWFLCWCWCILSSYKSSFWGSISKKLHFGHKQPINIELQKLDL